MYAFKIVVSTLVVLFTALCAKFAVDNRRNRMTATGFVLIVLLEVLTLVAMWGDVLCE